MIKRTFFLLTILTLALDPLFLAQEAGSAQPRHLRLDEAVQLALKHNHVVRIASFKVEEDQHAKEVAKSAYLPNIRNDSIFAHLTDTQFIGIPAGSLGTVAGTRIPSSTEVINQGALTFETVGTGLVQPLTQLFKIKAANDVAAADVQASKGKARSTQNEVALKVRQLYYGILVVQSQHQALEAKIRATEELQTERIQQVKYGSTLEANLIESRAQSLQAKQDLLTSELQLSDLVMQFNDVVGLPINSQVVLDPNVPMPTAGSSREESVKLALDSNPKIAEAKAGVDKASAGVREAKREYIPDIDVFTRYSYTNNVPSSSSTSPRDECLKLALDSNPNIAEAKAEVEKAAAGVREAKREYIPDVEAFSRYSYSDNVPFLARNYGTFGVHFGYDLFDGGKKRATLREREAQLAQATENLVRISDEVEVKVQTAYNKLERTKQMLAVSQELLAARKEAQRVSAQGLEHGTYLRSQAEAAVAQEQEAQTLLLQAQLQYAQAQDELNEAKGRR